MNWGFNPTPGNSNPVHEHVPMCELHEPCWVQVRAVECIHLDVRIHHCVQFTYTSAVPAGRTLTGSPFHAAKQTVLSQGRRHGVDWGGHVHPTFARDRS